jgi:hypothetical protein
MKLKDGKSKVLTLSYDDGVVQDIRLMEILDCYGLKATFNINTGMYLPEDTQRQRFYGRLKLSEAQRLYTDSGHEVAVHSLNHPYLERLRSDEVLHEILEDRKNIESQYSTIARGMAYPFGTYSREVMELLRQCGICYSRTTHSTESFCLPQQWLALDPTCHHKNPRLMELARKFAETTPTHLYDNWMFYLWGHSYEFDDKDNWEIIETFAQYMGGREDVWYATNIELYDYISAYNNLRCSVDRKRIFNPSCVDVWVMINKVTYRVPAGGTLQL